MRDIKSCKLADGQLRMTPEEEGIDTSAVGNPTIDSEMADIDSVLNILKMKNDRNRYSSLADEIIPESPSSSPSSVRRNHHHPYHQLDADSHRLPQYRQRQAAPACGSETAQVVGSIGRNTTFQRRAHLFMGAGAEFFPLPATAEAADRSGLHSDLPRQCSRLMRRTKENLDDIRTLSVVSQTIAKRHGITRSQTSQIST